MSTKRYAILSIGVVAVVVMGLVFAIIPIAAKEACPCGDKCVCPAGQCQCGPECMCPKAQCPCGDVCNCTAGQCCCGPACACAASSGKTCCALPTGTSVLKLAGACCQK